MASITSSSQTNLSVFFIPWYATGHLIPMADIASLFAARGVSSTILTTPANAALIHPTVNHLSSSLPIRTLLYPFPSSLSNLPPNAENIASVSAADAHKFDIAATHHSRPGIESLVRLRPPNAVIADIHFTWFFKLAAELNIPFLVFHAVGLFPTAVLHSLIKSPPRYDAADEDNEPLLVPGLPHDIHMAQSEVPTFFLKGFVPTTISNEEPIWSKLLEMEDKSFGFIVNSFPDIDLEYADYFLNVYDKRSWLVGPVAVATTTTDKQNEQLLAVRGGKEDGNNDRCLPWLDKQLPKLVVYVCFGSWCHFSDEQIRQLALGLETSGHPFLWVVREDSVGFLPQGFEERVTKGNKGLVVRGWAPQSAVLGHVAVGGFLTHCGWNSLLEGLVAGLPMATWPLVFEQFINEKLVTDVLRIGIKCRGGVGSTAEEEKVVVTKEEVAAAVRRIMNEEEEAAAAMRKRAEEYAVKAKEAVREGGSSYNGLTNLIEELKAWPKSNNNF